MSAPHVTAIRVGRRWALRALYPLVREGAPLAWVHVAMAGTWEGHPSGPFTFDRKTFEQCVRNFDAQRNPVPLDYEHATEWAPQAPAAGWVHRLKVADDAEGVPSLYALVEFTDEASRYVREGRYRFSSGVFDFARPDRKTGEKTGCAMTSLALTNVPFIDGQEPIRLSQRALAAPAGGASIEPARTQRTTLAGAGNMVSNKITKADLIEVTKRMQGEELSDDQLDAILAGIAAERGDELGADEEDGEEPAAANEPPAMTEPPMAYADLSEEQQRTFAQDPKISEKIAKLVKEGKDPKQAAAIAYDMQRRGELSQASLAAPPAVTLADGPGAPATLAAPPVAPPPANAAPMAPDQSIADPAQMVAQKLMDLTGLDAAGLLAAVEQNADAIKACLLGAAGTQAPTPSTPLATPLTDKEREDHKLALSIRDAGIKELRAENERMKSELDEHRRGGAERAVDALLEQGRCTDSMKPQLVALALSDRKRFDDLASTLPQVVPTGPHALSTSAEIDPTEGEKIMVDEKDPYVRQLRSNFAHANVTGAKQDELVREALRRRKQNGSAPRARA